MGFAFKTSDLISRVIRFNMGEGKGGLQLLEKSSKIGRFPAKLRTIAKLTRLQPDSNPLSDFFNNPLFAPVKGALELAKRWILNPIAGFTGWAFGKLLNLVGVSATEIWSLFVQSAQAIWRFDWNASDAALSQLVEGQYLGLASIWGGFVGQGLGWFAGISIGYGISFLCPVIGGAALARLVASKATKEALEELIPSFGNALKATGTALATNALISGYINYRKFLKSLPSSTLETIFGKDASNFIKNVWGSQGGPNMSFATQVEEAVERIDNKYVKAFLENLLEESWDSFTEAGFIVASEIDQAYAQHRLSNQQQLGTERSLELVPDDRVEGEKLTFAALPQTQMIQAVQQTINTHRLLYNRDVGMVIGQPIDEYVRAKPQSLRLIIRMYSQKQPPYTQKRTGKLVGATIAIPDVKRAKVDWEVIKLACGGGNGYTWGRFRATANLDNGRQMAIYGGSEEEAEERLKALLTLSSAKLLTLSISEEKKEGRRQENPKLYKQTTRVYPAYCTLINREEILDTTRGDANLKQNYIDRKARIELWPDHEPAGTKEAITRLFSKGL